MNFSRPCQNFRSFRAFSTLCVKCLSKLRTLPYFAHFAVLCTKFAERKVHLWSYCSTWQCHGDTETCLVSANCADSNKKKKKKSQTVDCNTLQVLSGSTWKMPPASATFVEGYTLVSSHLPMWSMKACCSRNDEDQCAVPHDKTMLLPPFACWWGYQVEQSDPRFTGVDEEAGQMIGLYTWTVNFCRSGGNLDDWPDEPGTLETITWLGIRAGAQMKCGIIGGIWNEWRLKNKCSLVQHVGALSRYVTM